MAFSKIEFRNLEKQVRVLRKEQNLEPARNPPLSIEFLKLNRANAKDELEFIALSTLLQDEYAWYGLDRERIEVARAMIDRFPDEPLPWISLAQLQLLILDDPDKAKGTIEIGIAVALKIGNFVRHAFNTQARVARRLQDYRLLERTLEILTEYVPGVGSEDIGYEEDFLEGLPENVIPDDVLRRYRKKIERCK